MPTEPRFMAREAASAAAVSHSKRGMLKAIGAACVTAVSGRLEASPSRHDAEQAPGRALAKLIRRLKQTPRRRDFGSVPYLLTDEHGWDRDAARLILGYRGASKQVWECSEIDAAWPNLMRESMNAQFFVHGHPDFLAVSATHGLAHLALFSEDAWVRFGLHRFGRLQMNSLIQEAPGVGPSDDPQDVGGFYGGGNNNIVTLQKRGAVFLACHDSIHAIARRVRDLDDDGIETSADRVAGALTNALIPDCILVPSVVGFLPELEKAGFAYAKAS